MSHPSWPGVEHALARSAAALNHAERLASGLSDGAQQLTYIADSWTRLAEVANTHGFTQPSVPEFLTGGVVPAGADVFTCDIHVPATTTTSGPNVTVTLDLTDGGEMAKLLRKTVRERMSGRGNVVMSFDDDNRRDDDGLAGVLVK